MYTLHSASLPPYDAELSRHAADRYALLIAVKERRAQQRDAARRPRAVPVMPHRLAIDASSGSARC